MDLCVAESKHVTDTVLASSKQQQQKGAKEEEEIKILFGSKILLLYLCGQLSVSTTHES